MKKPVITTNQLVEKVMIMLLVVIPFLTLFVLASPIGGEILSYESLSFYAITYIYFGSVSLIWIVYLFDYIKNRKPKTGKHRYMELTILVSVVIWIAFGIITSMLSIIMGGYIFHVIIYFILSIVSSMTLGLYVKMFKA